MKNSQISVFGDYVKMDAGETTLLLMKYDGRCELLHYGKRLHDAENYTVFSTYPKDKCFGSCEDFTNICSVMSSTGETANKDSFVCFFGKDGVYSNRFLYEGAEKVDGFTSPLPTSRKPQETVRLTYRDGVSGVTLYQYYTVFADSSVIAAHSEVVNTTENDISLTRLMSLQLDFPGEACDAVTYDGGWLKERYRHETHISAGRLETESRVGSSNAEHNPFRMVKIGRKIVATNLIFSGNHKESTEVSHWRRVRTMTGISDFGFRYLLHPGENFVSPEAIAVTAEDESTVAHEMQTFVLNHIIPPQFAYNPRPILSNSWEGFDFRFNGDMLVEFAEKSAEVGVEMMVLDDGWFGHRENDWSSLGDWFDNVEKTGDLRKVSERIHNLGMKFGLWVEPEMISRDSEIYRRHPEFAMEIPGVEPLERRHQLMMDLTSPAVQDYLAETLIKIFTDFRVDYVKWDHNRGMSDVYSHVLPDMGAYSYEYYVGQTKLLRRITDACPHVIFESCSSGGCRYDLGMLYFMPQTWGSDNSNAYDRLYIQEGTLIAYPHGSMGAHVARNSQPYVSMESRFNIASLGAFGYEFDLRKMTPAEIETVKRQTAYYKEHRMLLQYGNYYRIGDSLTASDYGGWMLVSDDKSEAIAVLIDRSTYTHRVRPRFRLGFLDPDALYEISERPQTNVKNPYHGEAYGDALNEGLIDFGPLASRETDFADFSGVCATAMYYFKKKQIIAGEKI